MPSISRRLIASVIAVALIAATALFFARHRIRDWWTNRAAAGAPISAPTSGEPATGTNVTPRADVSLDLRRRQLIGVRTAKVVRDSLASSIRTVGAVRATETSLVDVNVRIDGWIRDLRVDYTGQTVTKGQPLFVLYSPDLLAAEREYALAVKSRAELQQSTVPDALQRGASLVSAARQRLQLWDLPPEHLARLEQTLEPQSTVTFGAPVSGFVVEKNAVTGMHVTAGQTLYRLADLSVVWIEADAYEHDLPAVHIGATGHVTLDAYPTEKLTARVVFIAPSLQPDTRTAKVRFEVSNPRGRLKPGMYADVDIETSVISALAVPADAVIDSGREQIVFVARGDGTFSPRTVQIGVRHPDVIQILSGLKEGEEVATSAAFFLDSESQLRAGAGTYESTAPAARSDKPGSTLSVTFGAQPDPPKAGTNAFEVAVKDASGQPIADADVVVQFFMPPMPSMNMPAIRNTVSLSAAGNGVYRGTGEITSAGRWDVTVLVTRRGERLGTMQTTLIAR